MDYGIFVYSLPKTPADFVLTTPNYCPHDVNSVFRFFHITQEKLSHINCNAKHFQAFPYPAMWHYDISLAVVYPGHAKGS